MIFSNLLVEAIGWSVIHSLWQGAIIAFLLWTVLSIIKTKRANTRYLISNFALFTQIIISCFTFGKFYQFGNSNIGYSSSLASNISISLAGEISILDSFTQFFTQNMDTIVFLWIFGAILFTIRMLMGYSYIFYLRNQYLTPINKSIIKKVNSISNQLNITKKISVHESSLIQSPLITGWLRPMILFPIGLVNQLNTNEIEAIIAHELAHVSRHDILFNFLQSLSEIIYYYHPGIWWISNQIRKEREHSCDDIALQVTGNQLDYAKALLQVQNYARTPQLALGFSGKKGQLLTRVQRVLSPTETKNRLFEKLILSIVILSAVVSMSFKEHQKVKLDSFLIENSTSISIKTEPNETYTIELDSFPNGKDQLHVIENNQKFEVNIEDGSIKKLLINGEQIHKNQYAQYKSTIDQYWNIDEDSVKVFVVNKDTVIMNGEDIVVVQNENQPMITIKKNDSGNDQMQIVLGDKKIDISKADKDHFTAYKIEKVIENDQSKWKKEAINISSSWNIPDTRRSYFVDRILETDLSWFFHSIENGTTREIPKSTTPKIIVKTVDTDGTITNKVMLYNTNGNQPTTYYSVNEIDTKTFQHDINDVKLDLIEKQKQSIN